MTVCQQVFQCAPRHTHSGYQTNHSRLDPIKNTAWTTAEIFGCAEYLPDDNTLEIKLNKDGALLSPTLFCLSLQSISCLFLLLTINVLAQSTPTGRKTFCMARNKCEAKQWFLKWNMAADSHLWHPVLSPPAYLRKQVASCTPTGRGVPEKQMCGRV